MRNERRRTCAPRAASRAVARLVGVVAVAALPLAACDDENPFRNTTPLVLEGSGQIWELGAEGLPSGWDFIAGRRFFVGTTSLDRFNGSFVLAARPDGTLVFRSFSTIAPEIASVRTGIQDLGAISFASVVEAPAEGYSAVTDSTGVPVVEGHVYAFRLARTLTAVVALNYAKLEVIEVGLEDPGDPRSRFVRFRWTLQNQPLNRRVEPEGGA